MNFDYLTNRLLDEETTMGDIAFLPIHLGRTKKAILDLAKLKLDWDIEILENENDRTVRFGNILNISVPNEHWDNFLTIFDGKLEKGYLNLRSKLSEAMDDEVRNLVKELKPTLIRAFTNPPFDNLEEDIDRWKARFGVHSYIDQKVPVAYDTKKRDLMKLYENLLETYRGDVGNMEMLISSFRDKTPLSAFDIFKHYDYIYGGRVRSDYLGITMLFEGTVDMTFVISETVYVEDQDVVDAVEADVRSIKVVGNVVYPRGERFQGDFYRGLYEIVEDIVS